MQDIYFVRHAESDTSIHDDLHRPLTEKGSKNSRLVTEYLKNKGVSHIFSSPYARAVATVRHLAEELSLPIKRIDDFRERRITDQWIDDFKIYSEKQWQNFNYKYPDGESLNEVQKRNVQALFDLIEMSSEETIVVGSHGTALCTIINYFDPDYGFEYFNEMKGLMPWIVKLTFKNTTLIRMESVDVMNNNEASTLYSVRL